MLIKALCDYYDTLAAAGELPPEGFSEVKIHYIVQLSMDGKICCIKHVPEGEASRKKAFTEFLLPVRSEGKFIANIAEHRPLYLFGLNMVDGEYLTTEDETEKARKSHEVFVQSNIRFFKTINRPSPVINAYVNFIKRWTPEAEVHNPLLLALGKDYATSGYVFCLGEEYLHEDLQFKEAWKRVWERREHSTYIAQDAITGKSTPVARIHNKIHGIYGGLSTGTVLVGYNNASDCSYGAIQSFNSNISESSMEKYTAALNYLLRDSVHKALLGDMTVVYWGTDSFGEYRKVIQYMILGCPEQANAGQTEAVLQKVMLDAKKGCLSEESLLPHSTDTNFYVLGLVPNASRISVRFFVVSQYPVILQNYVRFQHDLQVEPDQYPVSVLAIQYALVRDRNDSVNPALIAKVIGCMMYRAQLPPALVKTILYRIRADGGKATRVHCGIIKAYINRKHGREVIKVALDLDNKDPAYLCGRLLAVLEKLQKDTATGRVNQPIRDMYFSSASVHPGSVYPKLLRLAEHHLKKTKYQNYYVTLIGGIMDDLEGKFPSRLTMEEQGAFMIGDYQQRQHFNMILRKNTEKIKKETEKMEEE